MNIKSYLTFLSRNKIYTAINVFGLSVSLMFVMLIGMYVWQECRVTAFHAKADRIEALGVQFKDEDHASLAIHHAVQKYLSQQYPEIESCCGVSVMEMVVNKGDEVLRTDALVADSTFFHILREFGIRKVL